jgi:hypothetical protein
MIIQSIHNAWDMIYNQYRNTVYKTLEDPITQKKVIEVVQYLYTKEGRIEEPDKGRNVDKQA